MNVGETNEQGEFVVHKTIAVKGDSELLLRVYETEKGTASVGVIPGATKKEDIYLSAVERAGPSTTVSNQGQRVTTDRPFQMKHHSGTEFKDHILVYNEDIPANRYILQHQGNHHKDTDGCFVIGDKNLQLNGPIYTRDSVPVMENQQHVHDIVVSNSKASLKQVNDFVKSKGKNTNGDYNMTLHVYEQLTAAERQQVIDPTFIVHPKDVDTQAGLFNLQRQFRNFTPTDQWEETGLNQALELEFTTP